MNCFEINFIHDELTVDSRDDATVTLYEKLDK